MFAGPRAEQGRLSERWPSLQGACPEGGWQMDRPFPACQALLLGGAGVTLCFANFIEHGVLVVLLVPVEEGL